MMQVQGEKGESLSDYYERIEKGRTLIRLILSGEVDTITVDDLALIQYTLNILKKRTRSILELERVNYIEKQIVNLIREGKISVEEARSYLN